MPTEIENCAEYPLDREVFSPAPKNDKTPKKLLDKFSYLRLVGGVLGICLITLLFFVIKVQYGQNISQSKTHTFQSIVDLADSGSEKLSSLEIPETSEMSGYRVIIRDLGVIMEKSDIMVKNGKKISEVLFGLDKEIQQAGEELEEFRHQAKSFYFSLANEMRTIMEEIEKSQWLEYGIFKYFIKSNNKMSNSEAEFICKRLEVLEKQIPGFLEQLKRVLAAINSVHNSADYTQGYLIDGEREAERALKKHWLGNIADYTVRKRAENELIRVRIIIKMLKEIAPSLINFEAFLNKYRRNIQYVSQEVKNVPIKPTANDMKYLEKAITDLEEQHAQFSSAKKQFISMDAYNARYLEENQTLEEQHTKFSSEEYKPVDEDVTNDQNNYSKLYASLKGVYICLKDAD
ncbi:34701_t:CDS:2, partial [Gigaspora margarita]